MLIATAVLWAPARADELPLTRPQFGRLMTVLDQRGTRSKVPASVAAVLGLKDSQFSPDIKLAARQDAQGAKHGFGPFNDHTGFFMFRAGPSSGQTVFHVDVRFNLVKAARSFKMNDDLIVLPEDEAQRELREEFAGWAKVLTPGPTAFEAAPTAPAQAGAAKK
jgi:hypothetical protein